MAATGAIWQRHLTDGRGGTHKTVKNILLIFLIFELGDPKIYMSIRQIQTFKKINH